MITTNTDNDNSNNDNNSNKDSGRKEAGDSVLRFLGSHRQAAEYDDIIIVVMLSIIDIVISSSIIVFSIIIVIMFLLLLLLLLLSCQCSVTVCYHGTLYYAGRGEGPRPHARCVPPAGVMGSHLSRATCLTQVFFRIGANDLAKYGDR